ncbi:ATP-dependent helicase [Stenotrophomonas acidaminiphila]|uniref:ATP-dependent helicase n=1 Tax=Stenotrophomonas acidaminiphila TaxID=128780 RepID=UPI00137567CA|nr:ATP-dependent helicase [Stenotrophomonas acidaminiphila]NCT87032.1 ATP-dependent helicase [Stenotrophomonas acidaminiphila]
MAEKTYTPEQVKVIEHEHGHAVVAAVAGSGKTETLVGRVRHLLRDHNPDQIAVVMFNRDAREAFQNRFEKAVRTKPPEIRTFNSMGNKIVNRFVQIGLLPDAQIVEKDYRRTKIAKDCFTQVFKSLNADDQAPDKDLIDSFLQFLLLVKSDIRSPEEVFESGKYGKAAQGFVQAFHLFEKERGRLKIRFFEDQLYDPVKLMLRRPETQKYVTDKVDHLIVDEAQDMNGIQIALLRILAGKRAKVMLVGDEDQAIYDWRGAKPDYLIRGFESDFSNATRYTLPNTFRFGHTLSIAASHLITRNANRNPKISISAEDTPRTRVHCLSLSLGLTGIGEHIQNVLAEGTPPDDIAVLVRTYNLSVSIELELHQMGVPYFVYGRPPLTRIPEISALVGVLQLASGRWKRMSADEVHFIIRSLLQRPALYLDKVAAQQVIEQVMAHPEGISDAIRSVITPKTQKFQADQIRDRADLLEIIATSTQPDEKVIDVLESYLSGTDFEKSILKQSPTAEAADAILANVAAFKLIAARHEGSIEEFLEDIDPLIDSSNVEPPDEPHVWIGSIHRAKGAQWPVVFVPGLAARSFPRDNLDDAEHEAERRLFYVASTRASEELYLAHPAEADFTSIIANITHTGVRSLASPVSPFLWEMDLALARHAAEAIETGGPFTPVPVERPGIVNAYFKRFPFSKSWEYQRKPKVHRVAPTKQVDARSMPPGTCVNHAVFGLGVVDKWIDQKIVRVIFDNGDSRMLVAAQAPIEVMESRSARRTFVSRSTTARDAGPPDEDDDIPF